MPTVSGTTNGVGREHPSPARSFSRPGFWPDGEDEAINAAMDVLYFGGVGHTVNILPDRT
jgi:hypothetical protein